MGFFKIGRLAGIGCLIAFSSVIMGQTHLSKDSFPINRATGRVSIMDSVKAGPDYKTSWIIDLVLNWGDYRAYPKNAYKLFGGPWQGYKVGVGFEGVYAAKGAGSGEAFQRLGQLDYRALRLNGETDSSDKTDGNLGFHLVFWHHGEYIVFEMTDLYFASIENELAKFEDAALLSNDGVHYIKNDRGLWARIKRAYFGRLELLARDLKAYITEHYPYHRHPQ
jgi:hypothetical protein